MSARAVLGLVVVALALILWAPAPRVVCAPEYNVTAALHRIEARLGPPKPPPGARSVVPEKARTVEVNGRLLTYDDIIYGYDLIYETNRLFSQVTWLGVGFQQDGNDALIIQELVWAVKPDLFIDIGTNQGGSAIFARSIMRLYNPNAVVVTVDPDPNHHLKPSWDTSSKDRHFKSVVEHPLWKEIVFIKGNSHDAGVLRQVEAYVAKAKSVFVNVDGDHSFNAVYADLCAYGRLVSIGSYMISQDTKMDRFLGGDAALAATNKYLAAPCGGVTFEVDRDAERLYYSQHLGGYLKRVA